MTKFRKILSSIVSAILIHSSAIFAADDKTSHYQDAVTLIENTADRICVHASSGGSSRSLDASGSIDLELSGLLRRLAKIGTSLNLKQQNEIHGGVLQSQVLDAAKESDQCKMHVFDVLVAKFLPASNEKRKDNHSENGESSSTGRMSEPKSTSGESTQITYGPNSPAIGTMNGGTINFGGK